MFERNFEKGFGRISIFSKPASASSCLAFSRPHIAPSPIASENYSELDLSDAKVNYANQLPTTTIAPNA